jgi:hypothetical protein
MDRPRGLGSPEVRSVARIATLCWPPYRRQVHARSRRLSTPSHLRLNAKADIFVGYPNAYDANASTRHLADEESGDWPESMSSPMTIGLMPELWAPDTSAYEPPSQPWDDVGRRSARIGRQPREVVRASIGLGSLCPMERPVFREIGAIRVRGVC